MSNDTLTPDICVIGAGAAGLSVAAGAARLGVPVVLIEKGRMGGDCLNTGCIPSKTLIASARAAQAMRDADRVALKPLESRAEWGAIRDRIRGAIAAIAPNDSAERFRAMGVTVLQGAAKFTGPNTLAVEKTIVRARRFVVATGSEPFTPPIPGVESVKWLTSDSIFEIDVLPSHLIVIGAGAIGIELSQAFRRLGSSVTMIEAGLVLAREDEELSSVVIGQIEREGVRIVSGAKVLGVSPQGNGFDLKVAKGAETESIAGSHLLLATGRRPRVENLGLERAGIAFTPEGIEVRPDMRTTNRRVFAIGDVTGGPQFTHAANRQASIVLRRALFRLPAKFVASHMPRVTYTEPELAYVGLSEAAARTKHKRIKVLRASFAENDRAVADGDAGGHVKVMTTRKGRVLGAGIVGAGAGELLGPWTLAVEGKISIRDLAETVAAYPTRSEISRRVAVSFYNETFDRPIVRRLVRWLRRWG